MSDRHLILMRHATAVSGGGSDALRRLTAAGLAEAERMGERLASRALAPDHVLCSSATRCCETWEGMAKAFPGPIAVDFEPLLYHAPAPTLLDAIAAVDRAETLLVLAHNPGISVLAFELGARDEADAARLRGGFAPATAASFAVEGAWSSVSRRSVRLLRVERIDPP